VKESVNVSQSENRSQIVDQHEEVNMAGRFVQKEGGKDLKVA